MKLKKDSKFNIRTLFTQSGVKMNGLKGPSSIGKESKSYGKIKADGYNRALNLQHLKLVSLFFNKFSRKISSLLLCFCLRAKSSKATPLKLILLTLAASLSITAQPNVIIAGGGSAPGYNKFNGKPVPLNHFLNYKGDISGGDVYFPLRRNWVINSKYWTEYEWQALKGRLKGERLYYNPNTGQLQKTPPFGKMSENCWPGVYLEVLPSFDRRAIPARCVKGRIPQRKPTFVYEGKGLVKKIIDDILMNNELDKITTEWQKAHRTLYASVPKHWRFTDFLQMQGYTGALGGLGDPMAGGANEAIEEFEKLLPFAIGFFPPYAYEYNTGAKLKTRVKLYDLCEICKTPQNINNFINELEILNSNRLPYMQSMSKMCVKRNPCKPPKLNQEIINKNPYYAALLDRAIEELKNSPEKLRILKGDHRFRFLRTELEKHEKTPPIKRADVPTQNIFDINLLKYWHVPGKGDKDYYFTCRKDSDCTLLTTNCCGCDGDQYEGSDDTLFAVKEAIVGGPNVAQTSGGYNYSKGRYCLAHHGLIPYKGGTDQSSLRCKPKTKNSVCKGAKAKCSIGTCAIVKNGKTWHPVPPSKEKEEYIADITEALQDEIAHFIQDEMYDYFKDTQCQTDSDCMLVSASCCKLGYSEGLRSIPKKDHDKYQEIWRRRRSPEECSRIISDLNSMVSDLNSILVDEQKLCKKQEKVKNGFFIKPLCIYTKNCSPPYYVTPSCRAGAGTEGRKYCKLGHSTRPPSPSADVQPTDEDNLESRMVQCKLEVEQLRIRRNRKALSQAGVPLANIKCYSHTADDKKKVKSWFIEKAAGFCYDNRGKEPVKACCTGQGGDKDIFYGKPAKERSIGSHGRTIPKSRAEKELALERCLASIKRVKGHIEALDKDSGGLQ